LLYAAKCVEGLFSEVRVPARAAFHSHHRIFMRHHNM
jgi:hypothetical protein